MMSRFSFNNGECLRLDGSAYRISQVIDGSVQLTSFDNASITVRNIDELLARFADGQLKFLDENELSIGQRDLEQSRTIQRGLADFPDKIQRLALRRYKLLHEICPDGRLTIPRVALPGMLRSVWEKMEPAIRGERPPCVASFYLWRRSWLRAKFDVRALIDRWESRGQKPKPIPERLAELIDEGIERIFLTPQRESLSETMDWIQFEIEKENQRRAPEDALPSVSRRMLKRAVARIDRYAILKARFGERYAREAIRVYKKGPICTRPLERVEVDNTPLDILVIDSSTGLLLGRPWITAMIDAYSRMVVGIHISFRKPNALTVLRCLKHAVLPKNYVNDRFKTVNGEWKAYGLIHQLVCDNGLEFHARDVDMACADLGIHVIYCPTRSPQMKGRIERFLKTLNYGLVHLQPGTTFANYEKRHAYDSEAKAVVTLEALHEIVHRWVIDIYSVTYHRGILTTPQQKWDEGIAKFPPKLPPSIDIVNIYLGESKKRVLTKNGIEVNSLQYASPALENLRRRCGDIEVTVRGDPDNLGTIFVLDEEARQYVEAKCTLPEYAEGITAEQHSWMLRKARKDYTTSPFRHALLAAKSALREDTTTLIEEGNSTTTKRKGKAKVKRPKANRVQRELMVQHEETRPELPLEPEPDEDNSPNSEPDDQDEYVDVPLFPTKRAPISRGIPEQGSA
ncbi:DDE-type integrase/transposase/recombinase [Paraburkholderia phenoliruptrix]|uniref:DDE-type integrase/transposase/recombinase n=1 Tax=Paraburkholderia phenoliruptrix TaxID=252970 RepID=A0ABV3W9M8_9BURK